MLYTLSVGILVVVLPQALNSLIGVETSVDVNSPENQAALQPYIQVANLVIQPVYFGGLIVLIFSLVSSQRKTIFNCLAAALVRWPAMFLSNVITSVMIIFGMLLFIIPGVWLFTRLFLVPFLIMLNNQSALDAIGNSFKMTAGYSFTILNDIIFLILIFMLLIVLLSLLQILHPLILLLLILIFQSLAHVIYYRHYEILMAADKDIKAN
jgi:hypothetical protein